MTLERYRSIVEDWDDFWAANHAPEPVTLRVRTGLIDPLELADRLSGRGFRLRSIGGLDGYSQVVGGHGSVAQTPEHWLGLFHIQQAVMGLPSLALSPKPGETVLDLCAAPGGKTAHLSELMAEEGPLVAVELKEKRIRGLLGNLYRLGYSNVIVIAADGRRLPSGPLFDRVLVDAPCSGEGNYRRQGGNFASKSRGFTRYVGGLQEALLRRAIRLTRPGGMIVYSTCTYAPEENEEVLDRVLRDSPVTMEPIDLPIPHASGVVEWSGRRLDPDVALAWRVYPHHIDSGGLFMARLRRHGSDLPRLQLDGGPSTLPAGWTPIPLAFPGEDGKRAEARIANAKTELERRFSISRSTLDGLGWMVRGKHIWAQTAATWPAAKWNEAGDPGWRVVSVGLRALRGGHGTLETPSSHFMTRWSGELGLERQVAVDTDQLRRLLEGQTLTGGAAPRGPVAIVWKGMVLGRGMVGALGLRHELGRAGGERLLALLSASQENGRSAE